MASILLVMIPATAMAEPVEVDEDSAISIEAGNVEEYEDESKPLNTADNGLINSARIKNKKLDRPKLCAYDKPDKKYVKLRGVWGLTGDNESDGYFGGRIFKRGRIAVLKGLYNKTDNESTGKVFGIMKKGYFNGRVENTEGKSCKITGLYKIDRENMTFKMHWLTPRNSGWAIARIITSQ